MTDAEKLALLLAAAERWLAAQNAVRSVQLEAERLLREAIVRCR